MFSILKSDLINPFEPIGEGLQKELDGITARALTEINSDNFFTNPDQFVTARVVAEEDCILSGAPWVDAVLTKARLTGNVEWHVIEGATVLAGDKICTIYGKAKEILGKEKIILDFLSFFSSITTQVSIYTTQLTDNVALIYYNCLNIPGFSLSQEYAVRIGGGYKYSSSNAEECLISRHDLQLAESLKLILQQVSCHYPINCIKVEVASVQELIEVVALGVKQVRLYNFTSDQIAKSLNFVKEDVVLEVYMGTNFGNIKQVTEMGIKRVIIDDSGKKLPIIRYSLTYINT